MRLHRFIGNFDLNSKEIKTADSGLVNQIRSVLRLEAGDEAILCDGKLNEAKVKILEVSRTFIIFEIIEKYQNHNEPVNKVVLCCSVLKRENFELVVQKATEVGVEEIVPIITERTVKLNVRKDRLEKIIKEAAEQSGRGVVPILYDSVEFRKAVEMAGDNWLNLLFDQSGESFGSLDRPNNVGQNLPAGQLRQSFSEASGQVGIWIGPEGGWTGQEIELARKSNFKIINLGKLTLRAETAAITASYLAVHN